MIRRLIILLLIVGCGTEPQDCAGVEGGTAQLDCFGVCGGVAIMDDCGLCTGGTTGLIANSFKDCAGVCGGNTTQEVCDECNSGIFDCEGICNGDAVEDCAGVCGGESVDDDNDGVCDDVAECSDTDSGATDAFDDGCAEYNDNPDWCGEYDDDDFTSMTMCCACSDGSDLAIVEFMTPVNYTISSIYPNPFNPSTTISFSIPEFGLTTITAYDITGRQLETLTNEVLSIGNYSINWNASSYPSGVYLIRMDSGEFTQTQKVVLVK